MYRILVYGGTFNLTFGLEYVFGCVPMSRWEVVRRVTGQFAGSQECASESGGVVVSCCACGAGMFWALRCVWGRGGVFIAFTFCGSGVQRCVHEGGFNAETEVSLVRRRFFRVLFFECGDVFTV